MGGLLNTIRDVVKRRRLPRKLVRLPKQKELIYEFFEENERCLLMVLDACRFDCFRENLSFFDGLGEYELKAVLSSGSNTRWWFRNTFTSPLKDVVYVSANPLAWYFRDRFARVVKLWDFAWDKQLGAVRAGKVSEAVRLVMKRGAKKVIAHYLQPHVPFVRGSWLNRPRAPGERLLTYVIARKSPEARKEFVRAYRENVEYAMAEASKLASWALKHYEGIAIAITADHGECLGRWDPIRRFGKRPWAWLPWLIGLYREVGHPPRCMYEELVVVPWLVLRQA